MFEVLPNVFALLVQGTRLVTQSSDSLWLNPFLTHLLLCHVAGSLFPDLTVVMDFMAQIVGIVLSHQVFTSLYVMGREGGLARWLSHEAEVGVSDLVVCSFEEFDSLG